ncbi:MAG: molybdopterin-dependent oxidoreductase [Candidatus Eisenbacteria bacterium]
MTPESDRRTVRTVCPLDCWDACGMLAEVQGQRLLRLSGDPDHPISRGTLCARTYRYPDRVESGERILSPMRRVGDRFVPTSWDEALAEIVSHLERLRREGATQSILHVQSSGSMGVLKRLSARFWNLLGGVTVAEGDFCLGAGKTALEMQLGDYRPHDWDDLRAAKLVLLWGRDPLISGPHRMQFLKEARDSGARVVSINPLAIAGSPVVHETFALRPGSDAWLAAALARIILDERLEQRPFLEAHTEGFPRFREILAELSLERASAITGLPLADIRRLARSYAEADPAAILFGTGSIRYRNGLENAIWVTALPALLGYYGRSGGGLSYSQRHMRESDAGRWEAPTSAHAREVSAARWHLELERLDPKIEFLWVNGANPIAMIPDSAAMARAFARIPMKVVVDFHWTDTARAADLVLPSTSFLEEAGLVTSWGHAWLGWQAQALEPRGEARSDLQIWQALASRLGLADAMAGSPELWSRRLMGERVNDEEWRRLLGGEGPVRNRVHEKVPYADRCFPREGGRYLFPSSPPDEALLPRTDPEHPFLLLTPKSRTLHLSQQLPSREPSALPGTMSSDVARAVGRERGRFALSSRLARIEVELEVDPALQPGLIVVPAGGTVHRGTAVNLLIEAECAADGVTAAYFDCPVSLAPL